MQKQGVLAVFFVMLLVGSLPAQAIERIPEISMSQLRAAMMTGSERAVLIDARVERDFRRQHIVGAISLPADRVTAASLKKITQSTQTQLVFYCGSIQCPAGHAAAYKARKLGWPNVYAYREGIAGWMASGLPVEGEGQPMLDDETRPGDELSAYQ